MKTIKYTSNSERWQLERELRGQGFEETSDCFWYQNFLKEGTRITLEKI